MINGISKMKVSGQLPAGLYEWFPKMICLDSKLAEEFDTHDLQLIPFKL
jgi:hypothetical protein